MKKIIAILLTVMMVLAMAACGNTNTPAPDNTKKTLTMATNAEFPPYEYYADNGEITGVDVEIAKAICDKLGYELAIEDMAFDSCIAAVQTGKVQFSMAGLTVLPERQEMVDFSDSYTTAVQAVIVADGSAITTVDDLFGDKNYTIGAQTGTTGELYATWDIEDKGLGTVERYNKGADAVQALLAGKIDCVIIDDAVAKNFVAANTGLKVLDTEYVTENYAIAMQKGNDELNTQINEALKALIADGTVQSIIDKYITE